MTDNITLLLSLDNYVYGVLSFALEICPFNVIQRMTVDTTYLFGIKTLKIFAPSKDIEDIIRWTTNCEFKPLFSKENESDIVITTEYKRCKINVDYTFNVNKVSVLTLNIIENYNNILKQNIENEFQAFCNDFIEDYETLKIIDRTFEDIQDADMMQQCNALMNHYVQDTILN